MVAKTSQTPHLKQSIIMM